MAHSRQLLDGDDSYSLQFPELCQGLERPLGWRGTEMTYVPWAEEEGEESPWAGQDWILGGADEGGG